MSLEIYMPRMGSTTMESGALLSWLVSEGDVVTEGQPIAEVETDKITIEIPSPGDGRIRQLLAKPGDEVPVGATMGWIDQNS